VWTMERYSRFLTINSRCSSIRFSLYAMGETEHLVLKGELGRIGVSQGFLQVKDHESNELTDQELNMPDHAIALKDLFAWLRGHAVVGHRPQGQSGHGLEAAQMLLNDEGIANDLLGLLRNGL
jgi:acetate kinase